MKVAVRGTGPYYERGIAYLAEYGHKVSDDAEVLICLAHPEILKKDELDIWPKGCLNFHCGLPHYRGRHPLQWMLINGAKYIPCAVHYMDEGIDTGDIITESGFYTDRNETYASALEKVLALVGPLLVSALYHIEQGIVIRKKQEAGRYWPKRTPADSQMDFLQPSAAVHRFINAMADPMPNAGNGAERYTRSYIGDAPGEIVARTEDGRYVMATSDGVVLISVE